MRRGEIEALAPEDGEENSLADERAAMQAGRKAGRIAAGIDELLGGSEGALAQLRQAARRIERGAADHPLLAEALAALDRAVIEASEAEERIARAAEALAFDPARLEQVEARLFDIRGLARKHRVEPDALAALASRCARSSPRSMPAASGLPSSRRAGRGARGLCRGGRSAEPARHDAAAKLDAAVAGELAPLKLDSARFRTAIAAPSRARRASTGSNSKSRPIPARRSGR